ncbi:hypothetical protein H2200_007485 [Cladophialophora chaetospira]|uniref:DUF6536 domain-containing protein n=1 Tax=Cladophialophora chaetospira TaxID=386627 RepID=A0AA38X7W0_9EURO|nr:hypothetical protein H2200_007485 [Cladophialophora chaetospira]
MFRCRTSRASTLQSNEYELTTTNRDTDAWQLGEPSQQLKEEPEDDIVSEAALYSGDQIVWLQRAVNTPSHLEPSEPPVEAPYEHRAGATAPHAKHESDASRGTAEHAQLLGLHDLPDDEASDDGKTGRSSYTDSDPKAGGTESGRKTPLRELYNGVLYKGSCSMTKRWTTLSSLILNFIATLTIGSSNYVMQCLSSPSEDELRHAHKNGRSLQIAVSSPTNIAFVAGKKTILWWLLGITSIPVHLLFNSAFFSSIQTNNYAIAVVTSNYNESSHWSYCTENNSNYNVANWNSLACSVVADAENGGNYERLENRDCITRYTRRIQSQYSNVILVSNASSVKPGDRAEYDLWPSFYNFLSWNNSGNDSGTSSNPSH